MVNNFHGSGYLRQNQYYAPRKRRFMDNACTICSPQCSRLVLCVTLYCYDSVGRATVSLRSHEETMEGGLDWNATIKQILDLVVRMETDRQETLEKLCKNTKDTVTLNLSFVYSNICLFCV